MSSLKQIKDHFTACMSSSEQTTKTNKQERNTIYNYTEGPINSCFHIIDTVSSIESVNNEQIEMSVIKEERIKSP